MSNSIATYMGHAADGGLQNHSVGAEYASGFIVCKTSDGWVCLHTTTGKRTKAYAEQSDAIWAADLGEFSEPAVETPYGAGRGIACRGGASCQL